MFSYASFLFKKYKYRNKYKVSRFKTYFNSLLKASLIISTVPTLGIFILVLYGVLTITQGFISFVIVFYGSTFFAKPYFDDLSALTNYVEKLALDHKADAPPLSFLSNVGRLSEAVMNLHNSWAERKVKLESALAESTILFYTLPEILIMLDDDLNIVRANNAAFMFFGPTVSGNNIETSIPNDPELINIIRGVKDGLKGDSMETYVSKGGIDSYFRVLVEKFPVKSSEDVSIVVLMHDITSSRKSKQMTKDFVANASHEIRTPLTSILGFIENMQSMEKEDFDYFQKFLGIIHEEAKRMSVLINEMLSLSKLEMREKESPNTYIDILPIIQSSINYHKIDSKRFNMPIILNYPDDIPKILGDSEELPQVFNNLISNALKYGKKDSEIKVNCGRNTSKSGKELLYISVINEGDGIAPKDIQRLTERFYRVDKARSKKLGGVGLGLSIVKHIVNRHNAKLIITSEIDKGSDFTVQFSVNG